MLYTLNYITYLLPLFFFNLIQRITSHLHLQPHFTIILVENCKNLGKHVFVLYNYQKQRMKTEMWGQHRKHNSSLNLDYERKEQSEYQNIKL